LREQLEPIGLGDAGQPSADQLNADLRRQQGKHAEYNSANERQGNPIDLHRIIDDGIWR
jgi:hypothetical protein